MTVDLSKSVARYCPLFTLGIALAHCRTQTHGQQNCHSPAEGFPVESTSPAAAVDRLCRRITSRDVEPFVA